MHIEKIIYQNRRDFKAVFTCEHCGEMIEKGGYDDANFHQNVIPAMTCGFCGEKAGENYRALTTKHAAHEVI